MGTVMNLVLILVIY